MQITSAARSDVGRVRSNNEDSVLVDAELGLFVVCDGMGGHAAGEVASRTACEVLQRELAGEREAIDRFRGSGKTGDLKALKKVVQNAVGAASKEIFKLAQKNAEMAGMGTTVCMVLLAGHNKGILGHVGDSRLYVMRAGTIHQLSEDHTYVNELLKRGAITKEQAKHHPHGNVLSRALGVQPSVPIDTMIFDYDAGDTFMLCSDGVYNYFPDPGEILLALGQAELEAAAHLLIEKALERGGHDNASTVCFRIGGTAPVGVGVAAEQRIAILKRIPIFAHLTYNELVKVLGLTQLRQAPPGEPFIKEGELGDELFVVLAGEVDVKKGDQVLTTLQAGVHLGEMAMIDNAPRSATVQAKSDVSLLAMRREEFFSLIRGEPAIATKLLWSFVQVLSGRLRQTNEALQGAKKELAAAEDDGFEVLFDEEE